LSDLTQSDRNREFGKLVRRLREERLEATEDGRIHQWTRKKLAEESNLSTRQLAKIEWGEVANLEPYLSHLARAFGLGEFEKREFYAAAGYIYPSSQAVTEETAQSLLKQLSHFELPVTIRTSLWDFVAFNHFNYALYEYNDKVIAKMKSDSLGPNLLRLLFDQELGLPASAPPTPDRRDVWESARMRDLLAFRAVSFRYIATHRYNQIISEMSRRYPEFRKLWERSENLLKLGKNMFVNPYISVDHKEFEVIEFISLRVPQAYLRQDIQVSMYAPLPESFGRYRKLVDQVNTYNQDQREKIYFFEDRPLS
jgi:hypothetical protein